MFESANEAVASGDGGQILNAIIQGFAIKSSKADALVQIMALLEGMMDRHPVLGGTLMVNLYEHASDAFLYEVCDAIDIWMNDARSQALGSVLRKQALVENDADIKAKLNLWSDWNLFRG